MSELIRVERPVNDGGSGKRSKLLKVTSMFSVTEWNFGKSGKLTTIKFECDDYFGEDIKVYLEGHVANILDSEEICLEQFDAGEILEMLTTLRLCGIREGRNQLRRELNNLLQGD